MYRLVWIGRDDFSFRCLLLARLTRMHMEILNAISGDAAVTDSMALSEGVSSQNVRESDYDNDGLDPSEEYFRKKKKGDDEDTYFPPDESEPPHY